MRILDIEDHDINEQLNRLLSHDSFVAAPRRRKLLKYLVERTLAGQQSQIKGYAIGIDVFDRPSDFDPQIDSIVRVQAGRLRSILEAYYLEDGANDPVRIDLPKGGYIPTFSRQVANVKAKIKSEVISGEATPQVNPDPCHDPCADPCPDPCADMNGVHEPLKAPRKGISLNILKPVLPTLAVLGVLIYSAFFKDRNKVKAITPSVAPSVFTQAATIPTGPSVSVLPFETLAYEGRSDGQQNARLLKTGLQYELIATLSRFKNLRVVTQLSGDSNSREVIKTDFYLTGSIQSTDRALRLTSSLVQSQSGKVIWSKIYDQPLENAGSILKIQTSIASDVATSLGQPQSAVNTLFSREATKTGGRNLDNYYCLAQFYQYTAVKSEAAHKDIRGCLEKAVKEDSDFSSAWAALSWMYGDETRNGYNLRVGADAPEQRALEAAQTAVDVDRDNAMAHQYLAIAHFTLGNDTEFKKAGEAALRLNPNDPEVLADIGSHLIQLGNTDTAPQMVEKAIMLNPSHPPWYFGSLSMYYYMQGDTKKAVEATATYGMDGSLASQALLTAALVQDSQLDSAQETYQAMILQYPQFKSGYEETIKSWRLPTGMMERVVEDLKRVGLE